MFQRLKMNWKIMIFSFSIVIFALFIGGVILIGNNVQMREEELGRRLLVTGRTVAQLPSIIESIPGEQQHWRINPIVENIRVINNADYIVVMDMNRVRLSHPIATVIGTVSQGSDESSAFAEHTYLSKANGELGLALRAFVPIMNENHEQVGVVLVGQMLPKLSQILHDMRGQIYATLLLSMLFGIWGSWLLARHIKRQMFQLEPHEIAGLLVERTATFHAMQEGVIAIDGNGRITIFNEKARQMLRIEGEVIGTPITSVMPEIRLPRVMQSNQPILNQEMRIGSTVFLSSQIPIKEGEQIIGAVAIFQDRTEVTKLAEELTGVKEFVEALRVQNHEYMNKLHTIGGLIQLDHNKKALDYLFEVTEQQEELTGFFSHRIKDENITGLLLGKISRGKELGIQLKMDRQSHLQQIPENLDHHDIVILLGNLIENAFDALREVNHPKNVFVSLEQDHEIFSVLIEDNGCGMEPETQSRIFERYFSTKGKTGRGIGLHLIKNIVEKGFGQIKIDSKLNEGTTFIITFPMQGKELTADGQANHPSSAD